MKDIHLYNRYGDKVWLEHQEDNEWLLKIGDDKASAYCSVNYNVEEDGTHTIVSVDPSGGPYICIGFVVNNKTVTKIKHIKNKGFVVTLEDLHK